MKKIHFKDWQGYEEPLFTIGWSTDWFGHYGNQWGGSSKGYSRTAMTQLQIQHVLCDGLKENSTQKE